MKCQDCGAENPDGAEYCSLCLKRLQKEGAGDEARPSLEPGAETPESHYTAPGEWRGDAEALKVATSSAVEIKVKKFRLKLAIYGLIIISVIVWLVLSLTVWGNPSPGEKSKQLLQAINDRNLEEFNQIMLPGSRAEGEELYYDITSYLGDNGSFSDIQMNVVQDDEYTARSYIESGTIIGLNISKDVDSSDNLTVILENHNGIWYVDPKTTVLLP